MQCSRPGYLVMVTLSPYRCGIWTDHHPSPLSHNARPSRQSFKETKERGIAGGQHTWLTGVKKGFCSSLAMPVTMRHSPDVRRAATAALMAVLVLLPIASTAYLKYTGANSPARFEIVIESCDALSTLCVMNKHASVFTHFRTMLSS